MQKFYSYYLSDAKYSKQEALKAAQKKIREKHPNPYYWAAFTIFE
jgi:CHAT domain-containing protein